MNYSDSKTKSDQRPGMLLAYSLWLQMSIANLMDPDQLIDLYHDQIDFSNPNLKADFHSLRQNRLNCVRTVSKKKIYIEVDWF